MGEGRAREDCSPKAPCCRSCARCGMRQTGVQGHPGEPLLPQATAVPSSLGPRAPARPGEPPLPRPRQPEPHALTLAQGDPLLPKTPAATLSHAPRETPFSSRPPQPEPHAPLLSQGDPGEPLLSETPAVPRNQGPTLSRSCTPWPQAPASRPSPLHPTPMRSPW